MLDMQGRGRIAVRRQQEPHIDPPAGRMYQVLLLAVSRRKVRRGYPDIVLSVADRRQDRHVVTRLQVPGRTADDSDYFAAICRGCSGVSLGYELGAALLAPVL